jgi:hypothetical protein
VDDYGQFGCITKLKKKFPWFEKSTQYLVSETLNEVREKV